MKKGTQIWASILLFIAVSGCHPKDFQVGSVEEFQVSKLNLKEATIKVKVKCFNPNGYKAKLINFKSDVFVGEQLAGQAFSDTSIFLPAKDSFLLPVTMTVKMGTSFNELKNWAISPSAAVPIRFKGEALLKKGLFSFKKQFDQKNGE